MSIFCFEKTEKTCCLCDANNANANNTTTLVVCSLLPECLHNVTLRGDRVAFSARLPEHKPLKLPLRCET